MAGIVHIKSGNFHQKEHLPPDGSLAGRRVAPAVEPAPPVSQVLQIVGP